jgi:AraC-like DNA-binding protein
MDIAAFIASLGAPDWTMGAFFPHRSVPLHSMFINCGHELRVSRDYDLNGLKRGNAEFAIWQLTLKGRGGLELDGRTYSLEPGDAMMIHIPQAHRYFLAPDSPSWEFAYVSANGSEFMRLWYELERLRGPVVHFDAASKIVAAAAEIILCGKAGELKNPFMASSLVYKFLMAHFEEFDLRGGPGSSGSELLKRVSAFCLPRLASRITLDDMAEAAGYSKFHFCRLFRDSCGGVTPADFLRELRLKNAVRLLQMERMTVKEIASKCGFPDESYFCKVFKRSVGATPEAFRRGAVQEGL